MVVRHQCISSYDKRTWDIYKFDEEDSYLNVHLGDDSKYALKGERTIMFQLESKGSFDSQDMLYVLGLKKNFHSISAMEDMGFVVTFKRWKILIHP
jgi:hypothetical protein